ncbi:MAG: flagellin [Alphaproteobacteria bacterium]
MVVGPISSFGVSSTSSSNIQRINEKLQSAISSLVSGSRITQASDDIASLSIATQLQTELTALREVSGNVAQNSSLLQVADGGAEQISGLVEQLRSLSLQARSPAVNDATRKSLNDQFQQVVSEIDRVAGNTDFNGRSLLDGSVSGDDALSIGQVFGNEGEGASLSIGSLNSESLFDGQSLDILSADSATRALDALATALGNITDVRADIGAFQQSLDFVAVGIDSAIQNQEAARSVLADADIAEQSTIYALLNTQRESALALQAQTNRLPEGLLKLVE